MLTRYTHVYVEPIAGKNGGPSRSPRALVNLLVIGGVSHTFYTFWMKCP
jgi:hypothetical protein